MYIYSTLFVLSIIIIIFIIFYKKSKKDELSFVSASTLSDWNICKEQFFSMMDYQLIKPCKVVIVISESPIEKYEEVRRNGVNYLKRQNLNMLVLLTVMIIFQKMQ